jgi:methylaspartate ammonia-lyase
VDVINVSRGRVLGRVGLMPFWVVRVDEALAFDAAIRSSRAFLAAATRAGSAVDIAVDNWCDATGVLLRAMPG